MELWFYEWSAIPAFSGLPNENQAIQIQKVKITGLLFLWSLWHYLKFTEAPTEDVQPAVHASSFSAKLSVEALQYDSLCLIHS